MSTGNNEVVMSEAEFESVKQQIKTRAEVEALGSSLDKHINSVGHMVSQLNTNVANLQNDVSKWPESMNASLRESLTPYMTHKDGEIMKQGLEGKIDLMRTQFRTMVITVVAAGTLVGFILNTLILFWKLSAIVQ